MKNKNCLIKDKNFIVIHGWMINKLNLGGNELMVYSIIYGFTQTEEMWFTGSVNYIAQWVNTTKRTIYTILKSLSEKNLIIKEDQLINNVKFCRYRANISIVNETDTAMEKLACCGGEKISPHMKNISNNLNFSGGEKISIGGEKISPNNIDNNIDNIYIENSPNKNLKNFNENEVKETSLSFPIDSSSSSMGMSNSISSLKSPSSKKDSLFSSFENQNIVPALREWYEYKKERDEVLGKSSLSKAYETLLELSGGDSNRARDIVNYNINGNYSRLYPIKETKVKKEKESSRKQKKESPPIELPEDEFLKECHREMIETYGEDEYRAWLMPLKDYRIENDKLILSKAINGFVRDYIRKNYLDTLIGSKLIDRLIELGDVYGLEFSMVEVE